MGQDNQKTILKIVKEPHDKDHLYACLNIAAADAALKDIGTTAFAMWYYFARNSETYERWELSSKDVEDKIGLTRGIYNRAIHTLIEKGYLVPRQNEKNKVANEWIFYEVPPEVKENRARADTLNENKSTLYQNNTSLVSKYNKSLMKKEQGLNEINQQILQILHYRTEIIQFIAARPFLGAKARRLIRRKINMILIFLFQRMKNYCLLRKYKK